MHYLSSLHGRADRWIHNVYGWAVFLFCEIYEEKKRSHAGFWHFLQLQLSDRQSSKCVPGETVCGGVNGSSCLSCFPTYVSVAKGGRGPWLTAAIELKTRVEGVMRETRGERDGDGEHATAKDGIKSVLFLTRLSVSQLTVEQTHLSGAARDVSRTPGELFPVLTQLEFIFF